MSEDMTEDTGRPRWSAAAAARRCGVSRSTIMRALAAGRIPGAMQTPEGWSIPLEGLLAAGYTPDRPSPPDPDHDHVRTPLARVGAPDHLHDDARVSELEARLHAAEIEAERLRSRVAVAEAVAEERAGRISDLQRVVTALEVGRSDAPATTPVPTPERPPLPSRRPRFGRWVDGLRG